MVIGRSNEASLISVNKKIQILILLYRCLGEKLKKKKIKKEN